MRHRTSGRKLVYALPDRPWGRTVNQEHNRDAPRARTVAHVSVSDEVRKNNISTAYYEAGPMVYIHRRAADSIAATW